MLFDFRQFVCKGKILWYLVGSLEGSRACNSLGNEQGRVWGNWLGEEPTLGGVWFRCSKDGSVSGPFVSKAFMGLHGEKLTPKGSSIETATP